MRRDDGEPLHFVTVRVYRANGTWAAQTTTSLAGRYEIAGLPAGTYKVFFDSPAQRQTESEYHFNKRSLAGADPITVGAPSATTISAVLRSTGTISGKVQADDGRPLPNALVYLVREDGLRAGPFSPKDSAGNYVARGLLPGRWKVYFKSPTITYAGEYHANKTALAEADWLTVAARGELTGIDGSLARRATPPLVSEPATLAPAL